MRISTILAVPAIALMLGGPAHAAQEITFGIGAKPGSLQQITAAEFTKRANEKLAAAGQDYEVVLYDSAQIGNDKEMMQKLKIGSQHLSLPSSIMSSISGAFGVFDMPFIIKDREHLAKMEEQVFWSKIAPTVEEQGYKVLAVWENGVRQITNNVRPINTPADLAGIKLRTPKSTWRVKMFTEWGANPTPMAFSEVFVALQTGVIDGQENPLTNIASAKFQEVQKYLSMTGHVYSPAYPTASAKALAELPEAVQVIISETAREVESWARDKGAASDGGLLAELKAAGMEVNDADRAAFVEASTPIYEQFAAEIEGGQALIDAVLAAAE